MSYGKQTVNHLVDNNRKIKQLNENYKQVIKKNTIDYLKSSNDDIEKKIVYLNNLTHDIYRYGRKYKYDCSLNNSDITSIILESKDSELFNRYYSMSIEEYKEKNKKFIVIFLIAIVILFIILLKL